MRSITRRGTSLDEPELEPPPVEGGVSAVSLVFEPPEDELPEPDLLVRDERPRHESLFRVVPVPGEGSSPRSTAVPPPVDPPRSLPRFTPPRFVALGEGWAGVSPSRRLDPMGATLPPPIGATLPRPIGARLPPVIGAAEPLEPPRPSVSRVVAAVRLPPAVRGTEPSRPPPRATRSRTGPATSPSRRKNGVRSVAGAPVSAPVLRPSRSLTLRRRMASAGSFHSSRVSRAAPLVTVTSPLRASRCFTASAVRAARSTRFDITCFESMNVQGRMSVSARRTRP